MRDEPNKIGYGTAHRIRQFCTALILSLTINALAATTATPPPSPSPDIVFGFPEFPPHSYSNPRGEAEGYLVRLAVAMFAEAGIRAHGAIYPAPRLFDNLSNGTINFSMVVHNPVLDACCLFSKEVVINEELRIYHRPGIPPIHDKQALRGKKIITIRGYSYAGLITYINDKNNHIRTEIAPSHKAAFAMLDASRADYVLDYGGPAASGLASHPMSDLRWETIDQLNVHLLLSKSYPDAAQVLARLTRIAKNLQMQAAFQPTGK